MPSLKEIKRSDFAGSKDAIHVPVVVSRAGENLPPGSKVIFEDDTMTRAILTSSPTDYHAIADPFGETVYQGELGVFMLIPGSVKNLTHQFSIEFEGLEGVTPPEAEDDECKGCYS